MSPWQRPGRFSQHSCPTCLWSVPPSQPPSHAPCPPCGFTCFLPRLADLPTALLGRKPAGDGFQSHSKAKAGQARPHPRSQLPLVSGRWWDGGAVEDPEHWPREPGVNTDKSLELPSLPLSLSPYFTGKNPECCNGPTSLGLGFSPASCPPFSWPPPVSIFLEHLLCSLPHFLLSPSAPPSPFLFSPPRLLLLYRALSVSI